MTYSSDIHPSVETEDRPLHRRTAFWVACIVGCHLLILLHWCQWYLDALITHTRPQPWKYLQWSMEVWYGRAALAPLAVWLALRKRFDIKHWVRCVTIYVFGSIAIAVLVSALQAGAHIGLERPTPIYPAGVRRTGLATAQTPQAGWVHQIVVRGLPHTVYNTFTFWMLIGSVLSVGYYSDARRKQFEASLLQSQLTRVQLEVLRMQLKPHFLFNTLHSISTLIHEAPDVAENMVLHLSHLLRNSLNEERAPEVPLEQELQLLEWHLGIERIRFGDRLTAVIQVDPDVRDCVVPHLLLLPLVENAIEHGIGRNAGSDTVRISGGSKDGSLHLEVRNSNSILEHGSQESLSKGIGLSNTLMRLDVLYGSHASLEIENLSPRGVLVHIRLPLRDSRHKLAADSAQTLVRESE